MRKLAVLGLCVTLLLILRPGPAWAPFHFLVIEEVFFGTEDCPDAQYVVLRTFEFGQTLVVTQRMNTFLADGTAAPDFGVFTMIPNRPDSGVAMIMGTAAAQNLFGIELDEVVEGRLPFPDGRVCFGNFLRAPVDCVGYGAFTGNNSPNGQPATAPVLGMALRRQTETNNNEADFVLAAPMPENNAGNIGALGQGECSGPVETPTPTAGPTPTQTAIGTGECVGECDGDGSVTVDEIIRGVNIALGMTSIDDCPAFDADGDGNVTVDEIVTAVTNALDGCPNA
jgi:hypothetical protein